MNALVDNFLNPTIIARYGPSIALGMLETLRLAVLVVASGLLAGLLLASVRAFNSRFINFFIIAFADFCRAMPPLVLIIVIYFGLPMLGVRLSGFAVAWLTLGAVLAAFSEELFWAGVKSIPKGQWDAARSSGLKFSESLFYVVLPQAVRIVVPPITSRVVATVKNTALASTVAVPEMLSRAGEALAEGANTTPLTLAAIGYLILLFPLVMFTRRLEKRYAWSVH